MPYDEEIGSPLVDPEFQSPRGPADDSVSVLLRVEKLLAMLVAPRNLYHGVSSVAVDNSVVFLEHPYFFKSITFYADPNNQGEIYIGNSSVSTINTPPLSQGANITLEYVSYANVHILFTTASDKLYWIGEV
jgi:hypothetical protein